MATALENLDWLHQHEEGWREKSLTTVKASTDLSQHLNAVNVSMGHLQDLITPVTDPSSDEHALQLICIRLFNLGATSLKLGLSGYYQASFQLIRDSLEVVNLLDLFRVDPTALKRWRYADDREHTKYFSPLEVRKALEKHPEFAGQNRQPLYKMYSNFATHATFKSFELYRLGDLAQCGPFFDEGKLKAFLEDLALHLSHATLALSMQIDAPDSSELDGAQLRFIEALAAYREYQKGNNAPA